MWWLSKTSICPVKTDETLPLSNFSTFDVELPMGANPIRNRDPKALLIGTLVGLLRLSNPRTVGALPCRLTEASTSARQCRSAEGVKHAAPLGLGHKHRLFRGWNMVKSMRTAFGRCSNFKRDSYRAYSIMLIFGPQTLYWHLYSWKGKQYDVSSGVYVD